MAKQAEHEAIRRKCQAIAENVLQPGHQRTKDVEIELLQFIVDVVPRQTYLGDFLDGAVDEFTRLIRTDMAMPRVDTIRHLEAEQRAIEKELGELRAKKAQAEKELRDLAAQKQGFLRMFGSISEDATRLASVARQIGSSHV